MLVRFIFILLIFSACRYEPEFTIPEPKNDQTPKPNEVVLLENGFENDVDDWKYELSDNRSENKFLGEWSNDQAVNGQHSLKIQRLIVTEQATEGFYDFASWKKSITEFDVPFNADINFLAQLRLENVRGTGISLRINLKREGVQVAFTESGWINGNGDIINWQSYGCKFEGVRANFDEIELEMRMEPVTAGTVYFDEALVTVNF